MTGVARATLFWVALARASHVATSSSLGELTRDVAALVDNQKHLQEHFCPSEPLSCEEDKGRGVDTSTIGGVLFVSCVGLAVGTDVTRESLAVVLRRSKRGFLVGMLSQFGFMPLFALLFSYIFRADVASTAFYSYEACVLGMMIVGCLPGGNTSNLFTWFCGGNVSLSICMSLASNVAAVGLLPLLLFLFYELRFPDAEDVPRVPYWEMLLPMVATVGCVVIGMAVRKYASPDVNWWTAKLSALVALIFLFLAVLLGVVRYPHIITHGSFSMYLFCLSIQPAGYLAGWGLAVLFHCSLRDKLTVAFETGVQSFTLGLVMAGLGFNAEKEVCQFDLRCMGLIDGDDTSKYEFSWSAEGRIQEGSGVGMITLHGFLPGEANARATGGCCRFNELVYSDVFKYSAICSLLYPLHAFWMIKLLRKVFPGGFAPCNDILPEEANDKEASALYEIRKVVTAAEGRSEPIFAASGFGSAETTPAVTLLQLLDRAAARCGKEWALGQEWPVEPFCKGQSSSKPWSTWTRWTWAEYKAEVEIVAGAFIDLGLQVDDSVAIFGFNAPRWNIAALAAMKAGAKCCGIYPTDTLEQVVYKVRHSHSTIAVVEDERKLQPIARAVDSMPCLQAVVVYGTPPQLEQIQRQEVLRPLALYSWDKMLNRRTSSALSTRSDKLTPGTPCCLVYTSGTTGMPKAVMLSHDNICFMARAMLHVNRRKLGVEYDQERVLSYLPLSHIAGFQLDITVPITLTACSQGYATVYCARPYDLKEGSLKDRMIFVRPTIFLGVPRVWEKFHEGMKTAGKRMEELRGLRAQMPIICCVRQTTAARWARGQGLKTARELQHGGSGHSTSYFGLADAVVLSRIRAALGLDACKYCLTGAAPVMMETLEALGSCAIQVNEVYGMSESTAYGTLSTGEMHLWGSCGVAGPGGQVAIFKYKPGDPPQKQQCPRAKDIFSPSEEEQGEICFRGRHVMMGYLANPELGQEHVREIQLKAAEAIDNEGWLRSGDMGCLSESGFLRVTGRYKELIITAGGENVAPAPMEDNIKRLCPAISNVVMVGDKRKFNTCLVTLKTEDASTERLHRAALLVAGVGTVTEARESSDFKAFIQNAIDATNRDSKACPSNASRVQKFALLARDFTVEGGELTPTLKVKRTVVEEKFAKEIAQLYA